MFFYRNYIPAVPIREEQRLSEEEELARQLKREARIFFPDVGFGLWTEVAVSGKRTRKTNAGTA